MAKKIDISPKKRAQQQRSVATIDALVEAATYILSRHGPSGYTANKVCEKAGVNIASFYQYFPNKEALLFHIAKMKWEKGVAQLSPILSQRGPNHARRLKDFIREFFLIEAAEADLRQALRIASIDLRDTKEHQAMVSEGANMFKEFIENAIGNKTSDSFDFDVEFVGTLITSFAERTTDQRVSNSNLVRQADLLSDMLIAHFDIS